MAGGTSMGQSSFDDLALPLSRTTFVVVDLETTGGSPAQSAITEVGAVKVRGGEVLGEFGTLVNPVRSIPPFISVLTGITDTMVANAPRIDSVVPAFLEFADGAVLVAHNAPFDVGFLKAACAELELAWPEPDVVDTARLARRILTRDEAPNCKLETLARLFRASSPPTHRALDDARATVDVLHGLIERLAGFGVYSLPEVRTFSARVTQAQRAKRHLANDLPPRCGVYIFRDREGSPLYIGRSNNVASRVRQYFQSSEPRTRMADMIAQCDRVDAVPCAHVLQSEVLELRLIAEHQPPFNRRSRHPERTVYVKLTAETYPRLAVARSVKDDGATYLGPFGSSSAAQRAITALHATYPIRQCTGRLARSGGGPRCMLADLGRCPAPCDGTVEPDTYDLIVTDVRDAITGAPDQVVGTIRQRIATLSEAQRYEEAAEYRDALHAFLHGAIRCERLTAIAGVADITAARIGFGGAWEIAVIRYGALAAAGTAPSAAAVPDAARDLRAQAPEFAAGVGPLPHATLEESQAIWKWLTTTGTRLVAVDGTFDVPANGAHRFQEIISDVDRAIDPFRDRRGLRPSRRIDATA